MKKTTRKLSTCLLSSAMVAGALFAASSDALAERKCDCTDHAGDELHCVDTYTTVRTISPATGSDYVTVTGGSTYLYVACSGSATFSGLWNQDPSQIVCNIGSPDISLVKCGGSLECGQSGTKGCF